MNVNGAEMDHDVLLVVAPLVVAQVILKSALHELCVCVWRLCSLCLNSSNILQGQRTFWLRIDGRRRIAEYRRRRLCELALGTAHIERRIHDADVELRAEEDATVARNARVERLVSRQLFYG